MHLLGPFTKFVTMCGTYNVEPVYELTTKYRLISLAEVTRNWERHKTKSKSESIHVHAMRALLNKYRYNHVHSHTSQQVVASGQFRVPSALPQGTDSLISTEQETRWAHNWSRHSGEQKKNRLPLPVMNPQFLGHPVQSIVRNHLHVVSSRKHSNPRRLFVRKTVLNRPV